MPEADSSAHFSSGIANREEQGVKEKKKTREKMKKVNAECSSSCINSFVSFVIAV